MQSPEVPPSVAAATIKRCNMRICKVLLVLSLFACLLRAQAPPAKQQNAAAPAFLGPCSDFICEFQNDWSRNHALIYGLAKAMPEHPRGEIGDLVHTLLKFGSHKLVSRIAPRAFATRPECH